MSHVQELLSERERLERELESARFMLGNINTALLEDQRTLDAHHLARVEIAVTIATKETLLQSLNDELESLAEEANDVRLDNEA